MPPAPAEGRTAWALLLASSAVYFFSLNEADNDLWGHVRFGRDMLASGVITRVDHYSYTAAGHAWINHEWLSQLTFARLYAGGGGPALLLAKFAVALATLVLLLWRLRLRAATPYVWGGVGLVTTALLARGYAVRPQIFSYFGVALLLAIFDRHGDEGSSPATAQLKGGDGVPSRRIDGVSQLDASPARTNTSGCEQTMPSRAAAAAFWAIPLWFVLWANLHGGFVLGLTIMAVYVGSRWLDASCWSRENRRSEPPLLLWGLLALSSAATICNPYGPRLLTYVWEELSRPHPLTEWQSTQPAAVEDRVFFVTLAVLVVTVPLMRQWRRRGWQVLLALAAGVMALQHQRHTPVFALCAALPLADQLEHLTQWMRQRAALQLGTGAQRIIAAALISLAVLQSIWTVQRLYADRLQIVYDPHEYPVAAVAALRRTDVSLNLAVPLDWGEYVLWFLAPRVKVSLDGRFATVFPPEVVDDNMEFFRGASDWQRLVQRYPTEAALVPATESSPLAAQPEWQLVFADTVAQLYVRRDSHAAAALQGLGVAPGPAVTQRSAAWP